MVQLYQSIAIASFAILSLGTHVIGMVKASDRPLTIMCAQERRSHLLEC
ncbi:MAG: hypothetical protein SAK29_24690 [Scytonema sp. PMC 1069.18]|nr:hypothetical protein [Scytonema sp. PMC 1069.18]MEC4887970.1 hypothetical protein [Scytonema sp. PMC 1070.18]